MTERKAILARERTEEAKLWRRLHGDRGCKFADKRLRMSRRPVSNTISTVTKDNLLCSEYE